jgi:DNA topoisomerase-3
MKTLIVVEKKSVACKIAATGRKYLGDFKLNTGVLIDEAGYQKNEQKYNSILGRMKKLENDGYIICFASGHLVTLCSAMDYNPSYKNWRNIPFPYVPKPFKTKIMPGSKDLFDTIKAEMTREDVDLIVNGCDADLEGSNIFKNIEEKINHNKPIKRLWVDSHAESQLLKALKNMEDNKAYENQEIAGKCRMYSDWLLGAALTAKTTIALNNNSKGILSVGRVQTAVLSEIVRIENQIVNFKSMKYYHIKGIFSKDNKNVEMVAKDENYDDLKLVETIISKLPDEGKIVSCDVKKKKKYSDPLYDLTALQMDMSKKYSISPDETLSICQKLYEKGNLTYPRTSSRYITKSDVPDFKKMLNALSSRYPLLVKYPFKENKRVVCDEKVESHTAITPTMECPDVSKLSEKDKLVYESVVNRVASVLHPPSENEVTEVQLSCGKLIFKVNGNIENSPGWKAVYGLEHKAVIIPKFTVGEILKKVECEPKEVNTNPPKRYTEATILGFMKTCGKKVTDDDIKEIMANKGIGTAATRASIIKKLASTNYIVLNKKNLVPTDKGKELIEIFPVKELKNAEFTGRMQLALHNVEKGDMEPRKFMGGIINLYKKSCRDIDNTDKKIGKDDRVDNRDSKMKCPLCNSNVFKVKSKYGEFYSCSGYKKGCNFKITPVCGKLLTEDQVENLLKNGRLDKVEGLVTKTGSKLEKVNIILNDKKAVVLELENNDK